MPLSDIKSDFPTLNQKINGNDLIYLDNAATTQKPISVINAVSDYYKKTNSNIHRGVHTLSQEATEKYENARKKIAKFINSNEKEIIFVRGATEAINLVANSYVRPLLKPKDQNRGLHLLPLLYQSMLYNSMGAF